MRMLCLSLVVLVLSAIYVDSVEARCGSKAAGRRQARQEHRAARHAR